MLVCILRFYALEFRVQGLVLKVHVYAIRVRDQNSRRLYTKG